MSLPSMNKGPRSDAQRLKPNSTRCSYRGAEALRHPKSGGPELEINFTGGGQECPSHTCLYWEAAGRDWGGGLFCGEGVDESVSGQSEEAVEV